MREVDEAHRLVSLRAGVGRAFDIAATTPNKRSRRLGVGIGENAVTTGGAGVSIEYSSPPSRLGMSDAIWIAMSDPVLL